MGEDRWQRGRQTWDRLAAWYRERPAGDGGSGALMALADVGELRRRLDEAELAAVQVARRLGRSWAEIATTLGVTRQSAWERWRDDDDATVATSAEPPAHVIERAAGELRRRSTVRVPDVIGLTWDEARSRLLAAGLTAAGSDPDGPPPTVFGWPGGTVTDQSPEAGARVVRHSSVRLWLDRGGGSGVREPRRPHQDPRTGRAMRDEVSDEAL